MNKENISKESPAIYPFDWLVIGYSLLMVVVLLTIGRPLESYWDEIIFYSSMIGVTALIIRFNSDSSNRFKLFIRIIYPGILFTAFYSTTGGTMFLLFDQFFDPQLTAFELSLFGANPTHYIDQHLLSVWLTEIISASYFAYYLMIPMFLIGLFIRKDYELIRRSITAISLTFFFSYMLFFLYPIEGPRYFYVGQYINTIDGLFFRQMVEYIIANGAVRGGCMPSTHFAVALVIMIYLFKKYRRVAWLMVPINIGLAIGTVWGRFHYVSDVFIGGMIGLMGTIVVEKYYQTWTNNKSKETLSRKEITTSVS